MRSAGNFNSEWGYLAPAPSLMRTARVVLVATAIGATAGAAVVLSLIDRPAPDHDRMVSISTHAIVTSVQAAPAIASPATVVIAAPVSATTDAPATVAATTQAQTPAPVTPQVTAAVTPPPPPPAIAPQVTPMVATQPAIQPQASDARPQQSVAAAPSPENPADSGPGATAAPKAASGFASLSDSSSATEAAPVETSDQALIPPQTVPPVKKPKPHAAYASNSKYQPTPGLGTVLRRLFSQHNGSSYYPNR